MGPRSVERGKPFQVAGPETSDRASMGPRSVERGKHKVVVTAAGDNMLQWGRVLLNAERACSRFVVRGSGRASMGPRSVERGKSYRMSD